MKIVKYFERELLTEEELKASPNHYLYEIIGTAIDTETADNLVIYRALYGGKNLFAKPSKLFYSKVDKEKYPTIKQEYKYEEYNNAT